MDPDKFEDPEVLHSIETFRKNKLLEKRSKLFSNVLEHLDDQLQTQDDLVDKKEHKVLILYVGGTIGMTETEKGLAVKKGFLKKLIQSNRYLCDKEYTYFNSNDDFLITPMSVYKQRIWYKIEEFEDIKDSATLDTEDWISIATVIEKNYDQYDSFIILHGTDTMSFTASALSFMLENLKKTVVITGSQVPLSQMRNDAFDNFLGALTVAGHYLIPEVTVFFNHKLFRGNRSTKTDAFGLGAFESPNADILGEFGLIFQPKWEEILQPNSKPFRVHKVLSKKIGVLKIYPMIPVEVIEGVLSTNIDGCIIEAFGAGNIPINRPEVAKAIKKACEKEIIIVLKTQCIKGTVNAIYAVGRELTELGVISALDMTIEACVTKLAYLFGKGYNVKEVKEKMQKDLCGELTEIKPPKFNSSSDDFLKTLADSLKMHGNSLKQALYPTLINYAAEFGYTSVLEAMKKHGASLCTGDFEGRTPLSVAAKKGQLEVIQYLLSQDIPLNMINNEGRSPLFQAIVYNQFDAARVLINAGAKIIGNQDEKCHLLMNTVASGDLDRLKFIYYAGIQNLNDYKNVEDRTVGHIAVARKYREIVRFLKEETDFNFNCKDIWGKTPLDDAKILNDQEIIDMLCDLKYGQECYRIKDDRKEEINDNKKESHVLP